MCSVVPLLSGVQSLRPDGLQHARLPCPSLSPGVCSNSCPFCQWCYLTILCHPLHLLPSVFPDHCLFQWVRYLHQLAKVLELQHQHQSFQWIFRVDLLNRSWKCSCFVSLAYSQSLLLLWTQQRDLDGGEVLSKWSGRCPLQCQVPGRGARLGFIQQIACICTPTGISPNSGILSFLTTAKYLLFLWIHNPGLHKHLVSFKNSSPSNTGIWP